MAEFKMYENAVDPGKIPFIELEDGAKFPVVGIGTFGSDHFSGEMVQKAVYDAAKSGFRHFDCAAVYGNEALIGESFQKLFAEGLKREEIWVTSKLWNDKHDSVIETCKQTLVDLKLDYLDAYLVHWPFPNYHPPGCDVDSRSPDARPYIHEEFMKTWRDMEKLVDMGLVRHIGTSNMTVAKMELLLKDARIKPICNQMELHPHFQQPELFTYLKENGIIPVGFCPIGSPNRPERDRTADDTVDIEDPVVVKIAQAHGIHPAVVCLKWAFKRGNITVPFSVKQPQMVSNLKAVSEDMLTDEEMAELEGIDKNCRLIKGQVFLWAGAEDWHALWDEDGNIAK